MISVITATFNRGYIIKKLYESLKKQTNKNFEWIVIDDGSSDVTPELFEQWKKEEKTFKIDYEHTKNGGKHRAINRAIQKVSYSYCFIVDSDDYLKDDAIEQICKWIETIKDQDIFAGVAGLKQYPSGEITGEYPKLKKYKTYIDANNLERQKKHLIGDKAEVYRTNILKKYPFPEFDEENFLTEDIVWNRIAIDGYKLRWFNIPIYVCEYLNDGLTKDRSKFLNNFSGFTEAMKIYVYHYSFPFNYIALSTFYDIAFKKGLKEIEMSEILNISNKKIKVAKLLLWIKHLIKGR